MPPPKVGDDVTEKERVEGPICEHKRTTPPVAGQGKAILKPIKADGDDRLW